MTRRTKKDLEVRLRQVNRRVNNFKYTYRYYSGLYYIFVKSVSDSEGVGSQAYVGTLSDCIAFCDGIRDIMNRIQ